jgi:hypothetical protein
MLADRLVWYTVQIETVKTQFQNQAIGDSQENQKCSSNTVLFELITIHLAFISTEQKKRRGMTRILILGEQEFAYFTSPQFQDRDL